MTEIDAMPAGRVAGVAGAADRRSSANGALGHIRSERVTNSSDVRTTRMSALRRNEARRGPGEADGPSNTSPARAGSGRSEGLGIRSDGGDEFSPRALTDRPDFAQAHDREMWDSSGAEALPDDIGGPSARLSEPPLAAAVQGLPSPGALIERPADTFSASANPMQTDEIEADAFDAADAGRVAALDDGDGPFFISPNGAKEAAGDGGRGTAPRATDEALSRISATEKEFPLKGDGRATRAALAGETDLATHSARFPGSMAAGANADRARIIGGNETEASRMLNDVAFRLNEGRHGHDAPRDAEPPRRNMVAWTAAAPRSATAPEAAPVQASSLRHGAADIADTLDVASWNDSEEPDPPQPMTSPAHGMTVVASQAAGTDVRSNPLRRPGILAGAATAASTSSLLQGDQNADHWPSLSAELDLEHAPISGLAGPGAHGPAGAPHAAHSAAVATVASLQPLAIIARLSGDLARREEGVTEIRLDPPELGRVRLTLGFGDQILAVSVVAERPEVADLLRRHADQLAQALALAGHGGARLDFGDGGGGSEGGGSRDLSPPGAAVAALEPATASPREAGPGRLDMRL